jgi:hypothetical protein
MEFTKADLAKMAVQIEKTLRDADRAIFGWSTGEADVSHDTKVVNFLLEKAFSQTMLLLDAAKLYETLGSVRALNKKAKKEYAKTDFYEDVFLVWTGTLERYVEPFLPVPSRLFSRQCAAPRLPAPARRARPGVLGPNLCFGGVAVLPSSPSTPSNVRG